MWFITDVPYFLRSSVSASVRRWGISNSTASSRNLRVFSSSARKIAKDRQARRSFVCKISNPIATEMLRQRIRIRNASNRIAWNPPHSRRNRNELEDLPQQKECCFGLKSLWPARFQKAEEWLEEEKDWNGEIDRSRIFFFWKKKVGFVVGELENKQALNRDLRRELDNIKSIATDRWTSENNNTDR